MSRPADLHDFTRTALATGHAPERIAAALAGAGWSAGEVQGALAAWENQPGLPPVPRRSRTALSAGMALVEGLYLVALAMVAGYLVRLLVTLIDLSIPDDATQISWQIAALRWPVAVLVVFVPLWLWLDRRARPAPGQRRPALSVWIGHVAMFVAALGLLGDALSVIYSFLAGDLSVPFLLKSVAVALVAALVGLAMQERRHD